MKRMFDFHCSSCDKTIEELTALETEFILCRCGEPAYRVISTPNIVLDGISGDFPGAADRWANIREQRAKILHKKSYFEG